MWEPVDSPVLQGGADFRYCEDTAGWGLERKFAVIGSYAFPVITEWASRNHALLCPGHGEQAREEAARPALIDDSEQSCRRVPSLD